MNKAYIVTKDAMVLIPNKEHRNFTASGEVIEADSVVKGQPKEIQGLRRGEPFAYKLFLTDNNKLIYLNKVKMENATEVTLGADSTQTPTVVKLPPTGDTFTKKKVGTALAGAGLAFWYAKHHKHPHMKTALIVGAGAVLGYIAGSLWENQAVVKVKASK